jgi:putative hydrolase of HD superfamily
MKEKLDFLIKVNKLKETTRTGWIIWRIENPETIAEHIFRVCFLTFLLGSEKGLRLKIAIQDALSHDLCEIYAGDATPFFYYQNLDVKRKKDREILMKGIRLSQKEKKERSRIKFEKEKKSLLKLVTPLGKSFKNEIFSCWLDYEKGFSREGKFVKQLDWIENLIQSLEYLGPKGSGSGWWEIAEEKVYDPLLLDFLAIIQNKFYKKRIRVKNKNLENILDFALSIGKLKRMPRLYWILRGIKNPETVAGHIFTLAIMAWIFGKEKKELNMEKLLKMALCHELSAVYTGDTTPYDRILSENKNERKKVLERMIRLSKKEKEWIFLADYKKEKKAMKKLTKNLDFSLKKEIIQLWHEYRTRSSPEAKFLTQLNILAVLLQGLLYEKKYKKFSAAPLWEWAFENCDDEICVSLMDEMKKKFYG